MFTNTVRIHLAIARPSPRLVLFFGRNFDPNELKSAVSRYKSDRGNKNNKMAVILSVIDLHSLGVLYDDNREGSNKKRMRESYYALYRLYYSV